VLVPALWHCSASQTHAEEQAVDGQEIEVTPEMLAAGARELIIDNDTSDEETVRAVLLAVLQAGGYRVKELA
jgi:hypothetical protein